MVASNRLWIAFVAVALMSGAEAWAGYIGFVAPLGWTRGVTADTTYQEWNVFTSVVSTPPLNVPDQGLYSAPSLPAVHDVYDASGGSFLTGGGNIYSPALALDLDVVVPNYNHGASGWTTLVLQTVTLGTPLDLGSVRIDDGGSTYHPVDSALLFSQALGGFGGVQEDRWFEFHLPGNAATYTVEMLAAGSSLSFDRVAIDTIWSAAALPIDEPNPVPEPGAGALALPCAILCVFLLRCRGVARCNLRQQ